RSLPKPLERVILVPVVGNIAVDEIAELAAVGQIVDDNDLLAATAEGADDMAADEAGTARHDDRLGSRHLWNLNHARRRGSTFGPPHCIRSGPGRGYRPVQGEIFRAHDVAREAGGDPRTLLAEPAPELRRCGEPDDRVVQLVRPV